MDYGKAFTGLVTCDLSDACDALGVRSVTSGSPKPIYSPCRPVCGPVVTLDLEVGAEGSVVIGTLEAIVSAAAGSVIVISANGHDELNTWGSIAGNVAVQERMGGVVIDGATRDVQNMRELDLPTYATGTAVASVRGRIGMKSYNEPITFAGNSIQPGWIVAADENGVVFFPADRARDIFHHAYRVAALEHKTVQAIRHGADAVEIHKAMRYDASWTDQLADDTLGG